MSENGQNNTLFACIAAAGVFFLSSCHHEPSPVDEGPWGLRNSCGSDTDCPDTEFCNGRLNHCAASEPAVKDLIIKISVDDEPLPTVIRERIDSEGDFISIIERSIPLKGRVWTSYPRITPVQADVKFIPGYEWFVEPNPPVVVAQSSENLNMEGDNLSVRLPPGVYDIEVWPYKTENGVLPPVYRKNVIISDNSRRLDIEIPQPAVVRGVVLVGRQPLEKLVVWAESEDGSRISTVASGSTCWGVYPSVSCGFEIDVATITDRFYVHSELPDVPYFPVYSTGPYETPSGGTITDIGEVQLPRTGVPSIYSAQIQGLDAYRRIIPVEDVAVHFSGDAIFGGSVQRRLNTDARGSFIEEVHGWTDAGAGAYLYDGEYDVTLVPSKKSQFAAFRPESPVVVNGEGSIQQGQVFILPRKLRLVGRVTGGPMNDGFSRIAVTAIPSRSRSSIQRSDTVITDEAGEFDLTLDPGSYVLMALVPESNGYPWTWTDVELAPESDLIRIEIGYPYIWEGKIIYTDGNPVRNAQVEIFLPPSQDRSAINIALTATGEDGSFSVLLPGRPRVD